MVRNIRETYGLKPRYKRLRERGLLTQRELARKLHVKPLTIRVWRRAGLLRAHAYSDRNDYLYEAPGTDAPAKYKWKIKRSAGAKRETTNARKR